MLLQKWVSLLCREVRNPDKLTSKECETNVHTHTHTHACMHAPTHRQSTQTCVGYQNSQTSQLWYTKLPTKHFRWLVTVMWRDFIYISKLFSTQWHSSAKEHSGHRHHSKQQWWKKKTGCYWSYNAFSCPSLPNRYCTICLQYLPCDKLTSPWEAKDKQRSVSKGSNQSCSSQYVGSPYARQTEVLVRIRKERSVITMNQQRAHCSILRNMVKEQETNSA